MNFQSEPYDEMLGTLTTAMEEGLGFNRGKSLRWVARAIDLDAGSLSRILSGKRRLQPAQALQIAGRLALTPDAHKRLVELVMAVALGDLVDSLRSNSPLDQGLTMEHLAASVLRAAESVKQKMKMS